MAGGYSAVDAIVGHTQINVHGLPVDAAPGRLQPGMLMTATDNWWGTGEFLYARAAGTVRAFGIVVLTPVFDTALNSWRFDISEAPNTANLGRMVGISRQALTLDQYGWVQVTGITPVNCVANIAADSPIALAAAGQGGVDAVGKQILNARVVGASTTTVVKSGASANSGQQFITVADASGWFQGVALSGTGIAAGTKVTAIDASGRQVSLSAVTTAQLTGGVTATYNDATIFYNVVHLNRAALEG